MGRSENGEKTMTTMRVECHLDRPVEVTERLLLNPDLLRAFVDKQHPDPASEKIDVDPAKRRADLRWVTSLEGNLPPIVVRLVGRRFDIEFGLEVGAPGSVDIKGRGRVGAAMHASLRVEPDSGGSRLTIDGSVRVFLPGLLRGRPERLVRDEILVPISEEDLCPLLREWKDA